MNAFWISILAATLSSTAAMASDGGPFKNAGEVVFCTELGDPPAAYAKEDGVTATGFEVDLMRAMGTAMGLKTSIKNFKFSAIFAAMESGQCDAVMSQTTKSPERLAKYDIVDYRQQASGILVKKDNPEKITDYESLSGKRVAVLLGSSNEKRLKEINDKLAAANRTPMTIATYQNNALAFRELELSRVDALASGSLVLAYFVTHSDGKFEIGGLPIPPNTLGIVISKSQPEKTKTIQAAFDEIVNSGEAQKIVDQWGVESGTTLCGPKHVCN